MSEPARISLRTLSLGAGVQSTTVALMAAHGEIDPPDCAIFADTGWEPRAVYQHLDRLEPMLPFPVHRVTAGNIREGVVARRNSTGGRYASVPWYMTRPDGSHALGRRQCTSEYKLTPIMREVRRLLGKPGHSYIAPGTVEVMIGISKDEAQRMKPARQRYMRNRWPLIERGMSRWDCLRWLERHGYPQPPKSACLGCPFHDNAYWRALRDTSPDEWADAVAADAALRTGDARRMRATEYMHPQRVPLGLADLESDIDIRQLDIFANDCTGMCGV
jgi:hypothetical protein